MQCLEGSSCSLQRQCGGGCSWTFVTTVHHRIGWSSLPAAASAILHRHHPGRTSPSVTVIIIITKAACSITPKLAHCPAPQSKPLQHAQLYTDSAMIRGPCPSSRRRRANHEAVKQVRKPGRSEQRQLLGRALAGSRLFGCGAEAIVT